MTVDFDALTRERLSRPTSRKWSLHPDAIGAWVAEMDFGTAPVVEEAVVRGVRDQVLGYLTPALQRDMAEATSDWYAAAYGWQPDPDRVHPVTDVLSALELAVRYFAAPDTPVIVPTPAYMPFLTLPQVLGRRLLQVPGRVEDGRWTFDLDRLEDAFADGGTLLLCNPHNPTGRVHDRAELDAIAEIVERHHGLVFADEVHAPLRYGRPHLAYASLSATTAQHTVTATSASKAWNIPGLKAAQLILTADEHEQRFRGDDLGHLREPSILGVLAAIAAYRHGGDWLREVVAYLDGNRRLLAGLLAERLPDAGFAAPEGTYLAWLDFRSLDLPDSPEVFFRTHGGVALTAGDRCGDGYEGFARLVFATPAPILREIVDGLAGAVSRTGGRPS